MVMTQVVRMKSAKGGAYLVFHVCRGRRGKDREESQENPENKSGSQRDGLQCNCEALQALLDS